MSPPSTSAPSKTDGLFGSRPGGGLAPAVGRLAYRLDEIAEAIGISRRAVERLRSAGKFPRPDRVLGRMPIWRIETIRDWLAGGGR